MRLPSILAFSLNSCRCPGSGGRSENAGRAGIVDAAYIQGGRAGHVCTTTTEVVRDGKKLLATTVDLNLTLKRFNDCDPDSRPDRQ